MDRTAFWELKHNVLHKKYTRYDIEQSSFVEARESGVSLFYFCYNRSGVKMPSV